MKGTFLHACVLDCYMCFNVLLYHLFLLLPSGFWYQLIKLITLRDWSIFVVYHLVRRYCVVVLFQVCNKTHREPETVNLVQPPVLISQQAEI